MTSAACPLHRAGLEAPITTHGNPTIPVTAKPKRKKEVNSQGHKELSGSKEQIAQIKEFLVPGLNHETRTFQPEHDVVSRPPGPIAGPGKSPPDYSPLLSTLTPVMVTI